MSRMREGLDDYLTIRRGLGFKLKLAGWVLDGFVAYADEVGAEMITTELAVFWARLPADRSPIWWKYRLDVVRCFAKHLQVLDPRTEVPPPDIFHSLKHQATPYFYAEEDVLRLMEGAGQLLSALRGLTYRTLIGLLSVTGMRPGEAIHLEREDIDWNHGILTIRFTKFGKSRQIPVDASTLAALKTYDCERGLFCSRPSASAYFLVSMRGTQLLGPNVDRTFHSLVQNAELQPRSSRYRPRLHDLRHTFAIRTLLAWYRQGLDVQAMLPRLSTYLGHVNPANTYWYLSAEPELLAFATQQLERAEAAPS